MTMVLDASVTLAWCFEDEACPVADAVLDRLVDGDAIVPGLWPFEVANVLVVAERRGRITEAQSRRFLELLGQLPIRLETATPDPDAVVAASRRHAVSAYDAGYLVLAERLALPLATLDDDLVAACQTAGVAVVGR